MRKQRTMITDDERKRIIRDYANGICKTQIAMLVGRGTSVILNVLRRAGVNKDGDRRIVLTTDQVIEIKVLGAAGIKASLIARKYSVSRQLIHYVCNRGYRELLIPEEWSVTISSDGEFNLSLGENRIG